MAAFQHAGGSLLCRGIGEAIARYGKPEIFNTDQGSQFTSSAFTSVLRRNELKISMDGRGRCMDNIFIEPVWRSLKYEAIYLTEMIDGFTALRVIRDWIGFYNTIRPHSSLDVRPPMEVYSGQPEMGNSPSRVTKTKLAA